MAKNQQKIERLSAKQTEITLFYEKTKAASPASIPVLLERIQQLEDSSGPSDLSRNRKQYYEEILVPARSA